MQKEKQKSFLLKLLKYKKSKQYYAKRLGVTVERVDELLEEIKEDKPPIHSDRETYVDEEKGSVKSNISLDFEPKTVEQLYELHKIDPEKYKITNYWSKLKSTGKFTSSVLATKKKSEDYSSEDFAKFLKDYKPTPVQITVNKNSNATQLVDIELSIADFHLAKKTVVEETLENRRHQFLSVAQNLINQASGAFKIRNAVLVISNDFFHTDTYWNTTTNGTPQDVIAEFDNEYEVGFDLLVSAITMLRAVSQTVHVILVQGNHDRTKAFYLAHGLDIFFKKDQKVNFDRSNTTIKWIALGNTFIGYHHGNCKIEDLPLLFATGDSAIAFGCAKYREIHTGDKHHYMSKEVKGVRIQQLPSLSGPDRWHRDHNYVNNIRAAILFVYDPHTGKKAEFEERIEQ